MARAGSEKHWETRMIFDPVSCEKCTHKNPYLQKIMEEALSLEQFTAGTWEPQYGFKSFLPTLVNREWLSASIEIQGLLSEADRTIGELSAFGTFVPDVDFFIMMHIAKEATLSNRIEGTQTEVEEALLRAQDINPEKRDDWEEVQSYIQAINYAIAELEHLPLSTRLLKQIHAKLLKGVRGKQKTTGGIPQQPKLDRRRHLARCCFYSAKSSASTCADERFGEIFE